MTWARHASAPREESEFAKARALAKIDITAQRNRATRTVASQAVDAEDCSRLLAMLGLGTEEDDTTSPANSATTRNGPGVRQGLGDYPWSERPDGVHQLRRRLPRR